MENGQAATSRHERRARPPLELRVLRTTCRVLLRNPGRKRERARFRLADEPQLQQFGSIGLHLPAVDRGLEHTAHVRGAITVAIVHDVVRPAEHAYVPYSGFAVGAAALVDDGRIITCCDVENASYGLALCAECVPLVR